MLRDYSTGYKEDVKVFSGIEIEHTPAYGKQTLFLARNDLTFDQILSLCVASNAEAVYFGANRTYMKSVAIFEAEAMAAMYSDTTTKNGLAACASDTPMWEVYPPTPLTTKWLVREGFITK